MSISYFVVIGFLILIYVIFKDRKRFEKLSEKREEDMVVNENEGVLNIDDTKKSFDKKSMYSHLLDIPVWAIYFLILSTLGITIVILAKIWFPQFFDEEFFWRITYSYLTLIISTVVISKMSEAINFVKKQK